MGIKILEGYGLTEAGCVSSINPPGGQSRVGSIGLRLPWQDMRPALLGADGAFDRWAAVDEVGTLLVRGPNLFRGYLNPVHNQGLWVDVPIAAGPSQRWMNTGDLGRVDADGYFWLTGRNKELIIRGGHNIDPKMIEEPMHTHPAVALAAAVGRPDAHAGEVPVLYVQLRPGATVSAEALRQFAQDHIAERAAWPKHVHVIDALPTTAVGKIFKPALVQRELESICAEEARACGVELLFCEAQQDARLGPVLRWKGRGDTQPLVDRLGRFTFKHEQLA
jgi:acyl-CoA synthetase (AMP-forming)/AMP-acid ligase II